MNPYIGHVSQLAYVEEHRLVGGRGDGMRLLEMNNGRGLQLTAAADRCCDITRLSYRGLNMGYLAPCGYVAPAYYDPVGDGFLKSFTAGFLTTCGLQAVGTPCVDEGEPLPLHGSIGNTPAEHVYWTRSDGALCLTAEMNDEGLFARKLRLNRQIELRLTEDTFVITDTIVNGGGADEPLEWLYHMNIGYPLLDEDSEVFIPSADVRPRDAHAAEEMDGWMRLQPPTPGYQERCYYHTFRGEGLAAVYQPKAGLGLAIRFDPRSLDSLTQWKMMGIRDYVLGLEPGNCTPDGRDVMRRQGRLKFLRPGETVTYRVEVSMLDGEQWQEMKGERKNDR